MTFYSAPIFLFNEKCCVSELSTNTFPQLTSWNFIHGLSTYTNPLEVIRLWGAIWTSALFNSQRKWTQLKFILRHCESLSQMSMQSPVLLASCTRKALPIKRAFGNEDVPLHRDFWQLATVRIRNSKTAVANISELLIKFKRSQAWLTNLLITLLLQNALSCSLRSLAFIYPHKIFH